MEKIIYSIQKLFLALLLISSITFPVAFTPFKTIIFLYVILGTIYLVYKKFYKINYYIIYISLFYSLFGLLYSIYGVAKGNPGAISLLTIMVLYPFLFTILSFNFFLTDNKTLISVFIFCAWIICLINIFFISTTILDVSNPLNNKLNDIYAEEAVVDNSDTYFKFTLPNISSLIFLFPFIITLLIFNRDSRKFKNYTLVIFMVIICVLSGRRAIFLTSFLGIVFSYILCKNINTIKLNILMKLFIFIIAFLIFVFLLSKFTSENMYIKFYFDQIASIFDFSENDSNIERRLQYNALMHGFYKNPLFGAGAGAAASYIRSETQPWAYELSYIALLYQYGIIGVIFYAAGPLFLIKILSTLSKIRSNSYFYISILSGFITFLLANATNPYLAKFDYMWVIFIPLAICLSNQNQNNKNHVN